MMKEKVITLMRHGIVDITEDANALKDTLHLSALGRNQINSKAKTFNPDEFDAIIISDSIRTHECAEIIMQYLKNIPVIVKPALNPWIADKKGDFLSWTDYGKNFEKFVYSYKNNNDIEIAQNPCWEIYEDLEKRVNKGVKTCKSFNSPLVITHSIIIRLLLGDLLDPGKGLKFASTHTVPAHLIYPKPFHF